MRMCYPNIILLASAASRPTVCPPQARRVDAGHQGQRGSHLSGLCPSKILKSSRWAAFPVASNPRRMHWPGSTLTLPLRESYEMWRHTERRVASSFLAWRKLITKRNIWVLQSYRTLGVSGATQHSTSTVPDQCIPKRQYGSRERVYRLKVCYLGD